MAITSQSHTTPDWALPSVWQGGPGMQAAELCQSIAADFGASYVNAGSGRT